MSSPEITNISPVNSDCLRVSAHVKPAAPPPIITYLVLLLGSLCANLAGSPVGSFSGTSTKYLPPLS